MKEYKHYQTNRSFVDRFRYTTWNFYIRYERHQQSADYFKEAERYICENYGDRIEDGDKINLFSQDGNCNCLGFHCLALRCLQADFMETSDALNGELRIVMEKRHSNENLIDVSDEIAGIKDKYRNKRSCEPILRLIPICEIL